MVGLLAVVVAALGGGIYAATQASAGPSGHASASPDPSKTPTLRATPSLSPTPSHPSGSLGDYEVADRWFTFSEHAGEALGDRVLQVTVRYPDVGRAQHSDAPGTNHFPLIVFAPGYRQCSASYSILLRELASVGYVVAAVDFPRTNCHVVNPDEADLVNQPADLAFVIQQLDQISGRPYGTLSGLINATRVAVAGHSDGGDTVAAMAGMSCCRYPHLRAAVVLAGAEWPAFAGRWFSAPTAPMLFVQGTDDVWNPQTASLQLYQADTSGRRYYLQLAGANHFTPYEGDSAPEPIVVQVTIDFLDHYLAGDTGTLTAMSQAGRVSGVSELVSGGQLP
jgi:predicted dienelactone hydrolase